MEDAIEEQSSSASHPSSTQNSLSLSAEAAGRGDSPEQLLVAGGGERDSPAPEPFVINASTTVNQRRLDEVLPAARPPVHESIMAKDVDHITRRVEVIDDDNGAPVPLPSIHFAAALQPMLEISKRDDNAAPVPMEQISVSFEASLMKKEKKSYASERPSSSVLQEESGDVVHEHAGTGKVRRFQPLGTIDGSQQTAPISIPQYHTTSTTYPIVEEVLEQTLPSTDRGDLMGRTMPPQIDHDQNVPVFSVLEATLVDDVVYDAVPFEWRWLINRYLGRMNRFHRRMDRFIRMIVIVRDVGRCIDGLRWLDWS